MLILIRLLLQEHSDQGLHYLHVPLYQDKLVYETFDIYRNSDSIVEITTVTHDALCNKRFQKEIIPFAVPCQIPLENILGRTLNIMVIMCCTQQGTVKSVLSKRLRES